MTQKTIGYVELEWICPNCKVKNPGSQRICSSCGSPQPKDVAFQQPEHQQLIADEAKVAEAKAGADIHCGFCGARNPAGAVICSQCGGDLKEGMRRGAGQVMGAFKEGAPVQVKCPHCGTMNPETAQTCAKCGGSMAIAKAHPGPAPAATKFPKSPWVIIIAIIALLAVCGVFALMMNYATQTKGISGTVQSASWEHSVIIQQIGPVQHADWQEDLPSGAALVGCEERERDIVDEPVPNATEVCGTPYTLDTGTGKGQVVQDCEYHVYAPYCEYTLEEWKDVDKVVLQGVVLPPEWPSPNLESGQRLGESRDVYEIIFSADGKTYPYTTSDPDLYAACTTGSRWMLNINNFGNVVSIEPQ